MEEKEDSSYQLDEMMSTQNSDAQLMPNSTTLDDIEVLTSSCGFRCCRPKFMQQCADIRLFTAFLCLLSCINGAISASYLPSVITAIERRFELSSITIGLVVASYEVGAIVAVIFVSYLGNERHIPLIIGVMTVLVGAGSCLFALPHFIAPPYTLSLDGVSNTTSAAVCLANNTDFYTSREAECSSAEQTGNELYTFIFVLAQTLIGVGSAPILTLGLSYIDSHVSKKASPQYLAFVYASATLGPVLGFGIGAGMMEVYVDFLTFPKMGGEVMDPSHPNWVGAWWVGFLLLGFLTLLCAPPFFAFPKTLKTDQHCVVSDCVDEEGSEIEACKDEDAVSLAAEQNIAETECNKIKDFPGALVKLLKNPVYLFLNLATVFEMIIVTGFLTYVPKYLQTQFDVKSSEANLYTGSLAIPGAVFGILTTGTILRKMKPTQGGAMKMTFLFSILCLGCFTLSVPCGCRNGKIAGITVPYFDNPASIGKEFEQHLTNICYSECSCDMNQFRPVCADNRVTFFSACHAGCRVSLNTSYEDCSCLDRMDSNITTHIIPQPLAELKPIVRDRVISGACATQCNMLMPFMALIFAISFFIASMKTPITMVTIRCVDKQLRSFSLGIQLVIIRSLALLPAPIMFGKMIDTTCLWWKFECGKRKNCLLYDVESFRYIYTGGCLGVHVIGIILFAFAWWFVKKNEKQKKLKKRQGETKPEFYIEESESMSTESQ